MDAIKIARWLRLQYLWVDAFCIVQGDLDDWQKEAVRMADIYAGAYITIAATRAPDYRSEILGRRRTNIDLHGIHPCGMPWTVKVRERLWHGHMFSAPTDWCPLFQRG
jgi:hypothetical protein